MPAKSSDLSTFKSGLKKERLPDFDVICGEYKWKVHSHVFSEHSSELKAIFEENEEQSWIVENGDPIILGHLILWSYVSDYGDLVADASLLAQKPPELTVKEILSNGKPKDDDMFHAPLDEDVLYPMTLHAQMYQVASKYGIEALKAKASQEIKDLLHNMDEENEFLLPILGELFGVKVKESENGGTDNNPDQAPPIPASPAAVAVQDNRSASIESSQATRRSSFEYDNTIALITEEKDEVLYDVLVNEAAEQFDTHKANPYFKQLMMRHPQFQYAVSERNHELSKQAQEEARKIIEDLKFKEKKAKKAADKEEKGGLKARETKPRAPRKRKEKEMTQDDE